ncbi:MAG TPA: SRPBCC domain-containing protein [Streptosporangiaceae bacterium]|nr:SRPBCC domain-containing protein [Streptosporangiaceae bacterium]
MLQDLIEREVLIEASREQVWAALTAWRDRGARQAVVRSAEPPSFLAYRWARSADTDLAAGNSTLVEFSLTDLFAGMLLRVVETGFASLHVTQAEQDKALQQSADGWQSELAELKEHAERPAV